MSLQDLHFFLKRFSRVAPKIMQPQGAGPAWPPIARGGRGGAGPTLRHDFVASILGKKWNALGAQEFLWWWISISEVWMLLRFTG